MPSFFTSGVPEWPVICGSGEVITAVAGISMQGRSDDCTIFDCDISPANTDVRLAAAFCG
jgi:hypothetical protein